MSPLRSEDSGALSDFELELYKSLRAEVSDNVAKVPALWLQKFLLVGAITAFLLTENLVNVKVDQAPLVIAGVVLLPILAALLDVKMLEFALHARATSLFIAESFAAHEKVARWEHALWGASSSPGVARLFRWRSTATWIVTTGPTAAIILSAGLVVSRLQGAPGALWAAGVIAVIYVALTIVSALAIYYLPTRLDLPLTDPAAESK